jgi:hypothetical protein
MSFLEKHRTTGEEPQVRYAAHCRLFRRRSRTLVGPAGVTLHVVSKKFLIPN